MREASKHLCIQSQQSILLHHLNAAMELLEALDDAADLAGDCGPDMTVATDAVRAYLCIPYKDSNSNQKEKYGHQRGSRAGHYQAD
jgi:hypothetical protein